MICTLHCVSSLLVSDLLFQFLPWSPAAHILCQPYWNCPPVSPVTSSLTVESCSVPIHSTWLHSSFSGLLSLDYFPPSVTTPSCTDLFFMSLQPSPSLLISLRIFISSLAISHHFRGRSLGDSLFPLWLIPVAGSWVIIFFGNKNTFVLIQDLRTVNMRELLSQLHREAPGLWVAVCSWWWEKFCVWAGLHSSVHVCDTTEWCTLK